MTSSSLTRGQFLKATGGSAAALLAIGDRAYAARRRVHVNAYRGASARPAGAGSGLAFRSRPDLQPPKVTVTSSSAAPVSATEGYLFLAPISNGGAQAGTLIVDTSGQPVWFSPSAPGQLVSNFKVQQYRGVPVLTWWEGRVLASGYGR